MNTVSPTPPAPEPGLASAAGSDRRVLCDRVRDARVGVYDHERVAPQRVRIGLVLDLEVPGVGEGDAVDAIDAVLAEGHVTLIETLAERIAARCLRDRRVARATVRVEKLDVFPDAVVGVEIRRWRA